MVTVFLRTLIIYLLLLGAMRLVGKRQIGELQLSELITTLMLSELAVLPISDTDIPLSYAILPCLTLLSLEIIISFIAAQSPNLRRIIHGAPSILIYEGRLNEKELKKLRIGTAELLAELRLKDIADIADVRCAILEDNGKLSVFPKADFVPLTPHATGTAVEEEGVALPVIVSGKRMQASMAHAGVDDAWVLSFLRRHRLRQRDVLLLTVDERGHAVYILKNSADGKIRERTQDEIVSLRVRHFCRDDFRGRHQQSLRRKLPLPHERSCRRPSHSARGTCPGDWSRSEDDPAAVGRARLLHLPHGARIPHRQNRAGTEPAGGGMESGGRSAVPGVGCGAAVVAEKADGGGILLPFRYHIRSPANRKKPPGGRLLFLGNYCARSFTME